MTSDQLKRFKVALCSFQKNICFDLRVPLIHLSCKRVSLNCLEAHTNIIVEQYRNVFAIVLRKEHPAVGENITYLGELSAVR